MSEDDLKYVVLAALREAFEAGVRHGEDSATAYEWGSRPAYNRDQMFADCIATYNGPTDPIQKLFATLLPEASGKTRAP